MLDEGEYVGKLCPIRERADVESPSLCRRVEEPKAGFRVS